MSNSQPSACNFKPFSRSLEHFFLTVGQNNFGNKIPFFGLTWREARNKDWRTEEEAFWAQFGEKKREIIFQFLASLPKLRTSHKFAEVFKSHLSFVMWNARTVFFVGKVQNYTVKFKFSKKTTKIWKHFPVFFCHNLE